MVGAAIYKILKDDSGVAALVASRIYPEIAPQNVAYPFVLYVVDEVSPTNVKDGASPLDVVTVAITCFSQSYDTTHAIGAAVRVALDNLASGTYEGNSIQSCRFQAQNMVRMELDKHVYIVEQVYQIRVNV
jgi:hypothetical protein